MKIVALDTGDAWVGTALSDALGIVARPYKTVATDTLTDFLTKLFEQEAIKTVVVGYPKTMGGTESDQTRKVITLKKSLEIQFPEYEWILWDERLSSKHAQTIKKAVSKEEKLQSHSIAAACILQSFLEFRHFHQHQD